MQHDWRPGMLARTAHRTVFHTGPADRPAPDPHRTADGTLVRVLEVRRYRGMRSLDRARVELADDPTRWAWLDADALEVPLNPIT